MKHILLAGAVAAAALLVGAVPRPAEALPIAKLQVAKDSGVTLARRGGGGGHGGGHFGGGHHGGGHFGGGGRHGGPRLGGIRGGGGHIGGGGHRHHHGGRGIRVYPRYYGGYYEPYYYGYYDSYYDDSCAWLRRKALRTDSSYWWRRYELCREGDY